MSHKNYGDYIELLKSREARPSFEHSKAIIETSGNKSPGYFASGSQPRNWAIGIAALILIALLAKPFFFDSSEPVHITAMNSQSSKIVKDVEQSANSNNAIKTTPSIIPHRRLSVISHNPEPISDKLSNNSSFDEKTYTVISVPLRTIKIEARNPHDIPMTLSQIAFNETDMSSIARFYLSLSGSLSQEMNSSAAYSNFSAGDIFLGGGYIISPHLSIGLIAGRETFVLKQPNYSTSFTTYQFVHDGIAYPSLIGHIDTSFSPQSTLVFSIGATMRYLFGDNPQSPYAEIFGGGSTEGAIGGAAIGASVYRFGDFSLEAEGFFRALILPTGSSLTKFGVDAQLRYDW